MSGSVTVTVQIGNSDDKLPQERWGDFCTVVEQALQQVGDMHFAGYSAPTASWQNACFVTVIDDLPDARGWLRAALADLAKKYEQESIAVTFGHTEFVAARVTS